MGKSNGLAEDPAPTKTTVLHRQRTDSGGRSGQAQGPALGAPAPEGVPTDLGYLEPTLTLD